LSQKAIIAAAESMKMQIDLLERKSREPKPPEDSVGQAISRVVQDGLANGTFKTLRQQVEELHDRVVN
jgi:hypothetical protein